MNNNKLPTVAIIPVGGLGTRFLPATKAIPKEMMPVFNKPLIQYAFEEVMALNSIKKVVFVIGRNKNVIVNHFDRAYEIETELVNSGGHEKINSCNSYLTEPGRTIFIRQQQPLGLGHAIWCARYTVPENEPFVVLLPDEFFISTDNNNPLLDMIEKLKSLPNQSSIVGVQEIQNSETEKYGIISKNQDDRITQIIEKPKPIDAPSNLALIGRYILAYDAMQYLEKEKPSVRNEIQLTGAMNLMVQNNYHYASHICTQKRYDCGSPMGLLEANIAMAVKNNPKQVKTMLSQFIS